MRGKREDVERRQDLRHVSARAHQHHARAVDTCLHAALHVGAQRAVADDDQHRRPRRIVEGEGHAGHRVDEIADGLLGHEARDGADHRRIGRQTQAAARRLPVSRPGGRHLDHVGDVEPAAAAHEPPPFQVGQVGPRHRDHRVGTAAGHPFGQPRRPAPDGSGVLAVGEAVRGVHCWRASAPARRPPADGGADRVEERGARPVQVDDVGREPGRHPGQPQRPQGGEAPSHQIDGVHGDAERGELGTQRTVAPDRSLAVAADAPQGGQQVQQVGGPAATGRRRHDVEHAQGRAARLRAGTGPPIVGAGHRVCTPLRGFSSKRPRGGFRRRASP